MIHSRFHQDRNKLETRVSKLAYNTRLEDPDHYKKPTRAPLSSNSREGASPSPGTCHIKAVLRTSEPSFRSPFETYTLKRTVASRNIIIVRRRRRRRGRRRKRERKRIGKANLTECRRRA